LFTPGFLSKTSGGFFSPRFLNLLCLKKPTRARTKIFRITVVDMLEKPKVLIGTFRGFLDPRIFF